ncbi:MAG TPA: M1 family metallopeptidase [Gemmatimonadaceae bacterium]|nr:M1 family metallopeptidase [Gemmatimonadaceae bacterium]
MTLGLLYAVSALANFADAQDTALKVRPVDYDFRIDLPDSGSSINGDARITLTRSGGADTLSLDLVGLHVARVEVENQIVPFTRTDSAIVIPLPRSTPARFTVRVIYDGKPSDGLIVTKDSAGRWTYFGDNWPTRARYWLPTIDRPDAKATVSWTITAPAGKTIVANGALVEDRPLSMGERQRILSRWRESKRIAPYLMVIAAAPLVKHDLGESACGHAEIVSCVRQSVYVAPEQQKVLPGAFSHAGDIVDFFTTKIGAFPYEKLAHLQSSTRYGGMENATAIFYADAFFRRNGVPEGIIAHETAHQWFGDGATEKEWSHVWLSEGFATYFAALYAQHAHGDSAFRAEMSQMRGGILADTVSVPKRPVIDTTQTDLMALLNINSYEKGGFVLHMLRTQLGDSVFTQGIRRYYARHKDLNALTDDLRADMEYESGKDLRVFFDQWLRRPGYPEASVALETDSTGSFAVVQQTGRFGYFEFPLPLRIHTSAGSHELTIPIKADRLTRVKIADRGVAIRLVEVDPHVTVLLRSIRSPGAISDDAPLRAPVRADAR